MTKMNPEVKAKWVAALRSGEYKQTSYALKDRYGHCCLGVLCDLYAKDGGMKRWDRGSLSDAVDGFDSWFGGDDAMPRITIYMWAGLYPEAEVKIAGLHNLLHFHNDDGRTFAEIADAIEEQL